MVATERERIPATRPVVVLVSEAEPDLGALDFARSHALLHHRPVVCMWWGAALTSAPPVGHDTLSRTTGLQLLASAVASQPPRTGRQRSRGTRVDLRPATEDAHSLVVGAGALRRILSSVGHRAMDELACPTYVVPTEEPRLSTVLCVARRMVDVTRLVGAGLLEADRRSLPLRVVHAWRPTDAHRYAAGVRGDQSGHAMAADELGEVVRAVPGAAEAAVAIEVHYRQPQDVVLDGLRSEALVLVGDAGLVPSLGRRGATTTDAIGAVGVVPHPRRDDS